MRTGPSLHWRRSSACDLTLQIRQVRRGHIDRFKCHWINSDELDGEMDRAAPGYPPAAAVPESEGHFTANTYRRHVQVEVLKVRQVLALAADEPIAPLLSTASPSLDEASADEPFDFDRWWAGQEGDTLDGFDEPIDER